MAVGAKVTLMVQLAPGAASLGLGKISWIPARELDSVHGQGRRGRCVGKGDRFGRACCSHALIGKDQDPCGQVDERGVWNRTAESRE